MFTILTYTYLLLPLSFLFFKKRLKDTGAFLVALYGIIAFIFLFADLQELISNHRKLYSTFYTLFEYSFFTLFIAFNIDNKPIRKWIIFLSIFFFGFQWFYFFSTKVGRLDTIPVGIETILLFIYIFLFFYESFKLPNTTFIYDNYVFWIAIGILLYLGGAFFLYILADHMGREEVNKYWNITYIAEILKNVLFSVSIFLYSPKQKKSITSKSTLPFLDIN